MFAVTHRDTPMRASTTDYYRTYEEAEDAVVGRELYRMDGTVLRGMEWLEIVEVERESKPCKFCGAEVQSDSADFCRACYYGGRTQTARGDIVKMLKGIRGVSKETVGPWHTGGGCWSIGAVLKVEDDPREFEILVSNESSIPEEGEPFGFGIGDADGYWWGEYRETTDVDEMRGWIVEEIAAIRNGKPGS